LPSTSSFERDYFDSAYRNYVRQNPQGKLRFYRRLLARAMPSSPRPSILEIGCGPGRFLASLDEKWTRVGSDVSAHAIALARNRNPRVHFVRATGTGLPFARGFDAIVAFDTLEHVPDVSAVFDEVAARLIPHGVFLFVVPVYDGLSGPVIRRLDRDPTHVHKC